MRLPAGTAGFRPRFHSLWVGGDFSPLAFLQLYGMQARCPENLPSFLRKSFCGPQTGFSRRFFVCRGRFHRCGCASSGCGRGWPACVVRRVSAPFGRALFSADAHYKEAAALPFRNVAAVWALRPVVRLSLSVRSRRCSAGRCRVRRRRRYSNCRSVPLRPPRRRAGSQRSRIPSAVRSRRPKPRSLSSCPSTAGARTRRRSPLPT